MSLINEHNCEAWFLDYHEGNLNSNQIKLLFNFLKDNPQFVEIFNQYEDIKLNHENTIFNVSTLYKHLHNTLAHEISGSDYAVIAYTEGILKNDEIKHIEKLVTEDQSFKELVSIYQKLKLKPDTTVVFKGKQTLKRPLVISILQNIKLNKYEVAAAALIFVLLNTWLILSKNSNPKYVQLKAAKKRPFIERVLRPENHAIFDAEKVSSDYQIINPLHKKNNKINVKTLNNTKIENFQSNQNFQIENIISQSKHQDIIVHEIDENINKISEKNIALDNNNVKTLNNDLFVTPSKLIIAKLLKNSNFNLPDGNDEKKSLFWQLLELAAQKYSDKNGKKFKLMKSYNEKNFVTFALVTEKFEFYHTSSKN